ALTGQAGVEPDDSAIQLLAAGSSAAPTNPAALAGLTDYTIEFWFKPPTAPNTATIIQATGGGGTLYSVQYNPSNGGTVTFGAAFLPLPSIQAIDNLQSAGWVHIAFTVEWAGSTFTVRWYLNGELEGSSVGSGTPPTSAAVSVAGPAGGDSPATYLSELAVYDRALTATEIEALYEAKDLSFNDRSVNVQAEIGFPDGPPVVDARVSWDVARVRNHITYARTGGTVQVAEDAASQAAYGKRSYQRLDFQNNSNAQVLTLAQRALAAWKDDRIRVDQVTIAARAEDPDLHKLFYDCQIGDLVEVRVNPRPGFTYDAEAHVIGIAHTITASDW